MSIKKAITLLEQHLRIYHSVGIDDVEITETKGYWILKKPCDDSCHHPIHGCLGSQLPPPEGGGLSVMTRATVD